LRSSANNSDSAKTNISISPYPLEVCVSVAMRIKYSMGSQLSPQR
jgi:hypothetical protein